MTTAERYIESVIRLLSMLGYEEDDISMAQALVLTPFVYLAWRLSEIPEEGSG
jgi:hypothetical protein